MAGLAARLTLFDGHALRRIVLESPMFMEFFARVQIANFEIASDAFSTFKVRKTPC